MFNVLFDLTKWIFFWNQLWTIVMSFSLWKWAFAFGENYFTNRMQYNMQWKFQFLWHCFNSAPFFLLKNLQIVRIECEMRIHFKCYYKCANLIFISKSLILFEKLNQINNWTFFFSAHEECTVNVKFYSLHSTVLN